MVRSGLQVLEAMLEEDRTAVWAPLCASTGAHGFAGGPGSSVIVT